MHAPSYPINFIYLWNGGPEEGVLQVQLKAAGAGPHRGLKERLRKRFAREMPDVRFSFEPSDIVSRVMSFGSPTPIEVAVSGPSLAADAEFAEKVREQLEKIPALRDVQFGQSLDYPTVDVAVDRERAGLLGVRDGGRRAIAGRRHVVEPLHRAESIGPTPRAASPTRCRCRFRSSRWARRKTSATSPSASAAGQSVLLRNVATVTPGTAVGQYERYNMQRLVTVTANIQGTDLGTRASQVGAALQRARRPAAPGERGRARTDRADAADARRPAQRACCSRSS